LQLTATDSQQDHENGRQHELWRENRDLHVGNKITWCVLMGEFITRM
jgi:hypothetical protein